MGYKIRKYNNLKRRNFFDTYEPKKRIEFSKEEAVPILVNAGQKGAGLGGFLGFWISSILIGIRSFFNFRRNIDRLRTNKKVVELRIKKHQ